ncbi:hypothetical protein [Kitasatospora aureofaciens]|uniref:hypothetical protein n=1 Tax=Kitasatospora aureofaciens TaxID=1894 RepID=UPI0038167280
MPATATGQELWDLVASGRPQGRPAYTRPASLPGAALELPYPGTDPLAETEARVVAAARHLSTLTALTAIVDGTLGVRRLEPHDLVGPHAATASIRGVRVARLSVIGADGHTAEYDPARHALVPARDSFAPVGLRLEADLDRVPEGYAPVREVVGLLEAGMHHATAAWLTGLLLPGWVGSAGPAPVPDRPAAADGLPDSDGSARASRASDQQATAAGGPVGSARPFQVSAWHALGIPGTSPQPAAAADWPLDPERFTRPFGDLLGGLGVLDVLCRRSAGRGPLGLAPSRRPDPRGAEALPGLLRAVAADIELTDGQDAPLRLVPVSPAAVAAAFTYPAHRVDAAACDTAFLLVGRRDRAAGPAAVRGALLAAGACYQRLALAAGAHGYFLRPVRSIRAPELADAARLRPDEVILLTLLGGRSRYVELSLPSSCLPSR